jgi:hypothetical protein
MRMMKATMPLMTCPMTHHDMVPRIVLTTVAEAGEAHKGHRDHKGHTDLVAVLAPVGAPRAQTGAVSSVEGRALTRNRTSRVAIPQRVTASQANSTTTRAGITTRANLSHRLTR